MTVDIKLVKASKVRDVTGEPGFEVACDGAVLGRIYRKDYGTCIEPARGADDDVRELLRAMAGVLFETAAPSSAPPCDGGPAPFRAVAPEGAGEEPPGMDMCRTLASAATVAAASAARSSESDPPGSDQLRAAADAMREVLRKQDMIAELRGISGALRRLRENYGDLLDFEIEHARARAGLFGTPRAPGPEKKEPVDTGVTELLAGYAAAGRFCTVVPQGGAESGSLCSDKALRDVGELAFEDLLEILKARCARAEGALAALAAAAQEPPAPEAKPVAKPVAKVRRPQGKI